MPYKSTNKIIWINTPIMLPLILFLLLLVAPASAQSECAKRPFPTNIALRPNESVIINLDEYFEGSNLTFKVSPNNSYSAIEPTYQCSAAGSQRMGKVIASRYFLLGKEEVVAALAESQFTEGAYVFYFYQMQQSKLTALNLPKEGIALCTHFAISMINNTHFIPTVDCNYTLSAPKKLKRALLTTVGQIGSPYADWSIQLADLYAKTFQPTVQLQLIDDTLIRRVSTTTNSYIQVWIWNQEAHQILGIIDKTFLSVKNLNIKSMKVYGRVVIVLDYQSGLYIFRLLPTSMLQIINHIAFAFFEEFEYNSMTGTLYLAKKGKIVSTVLNPNTHSIAETGEGFNIYKYEHIRKMVISDNLVVALGESAINIFRRGNAGSRHYSLYQLATAQMVYSRLIAEGFTLLLIQNVGINLQISSCRVRAPFLKLATPRSSVNTTVTASSLLDRQTSTCTLNFTLQPEITRLDDIYESGYRTDNEVVYANQQGEGSLDLNRYGFGRDLLYSLQTIPTTILQNETRIKKSLPFNCTFSNEPIPIGGKIVFLHSWQNLVLVQFSTDNSMRYYVCGQKMCNYALYNFLEGPIEHLCHQTLMKTKSGSEIMQAIVHEQAGSINVVVRKLLVDNVKSQIKVNKICELSFNRTEDELWSIAQVEIYNNLLHLVMPLRKEVRVYQITDHDCPNVLNLNTVTCPWGYFAPQSVHFNRPTKGSFLSETFLIRQWDEILTVRLENRGTLQPFLVTKNILPLVVNYTVIYTAPYLLAFDLNANRTYSFYFDDEEIIQYLREIPMSSKRFKSSSSTRRDFAKLIESRHLVLTMDDEITLAKVASVFKIDQLISGAIEYVSFPLTQDEQVTWVVVEDEWRPLRINLLNSPTLAQLICRGNILSLTPTLQLVFGKTPSTFDEYSENATLTLATADKTKQQQFKIVLSNVGDSIKRGPGFPSRGDSVDAKPTITVDDRHWFSGSIFDYGFDCPDCGDRIIWKEKVTMEGSEPLPVPSNKFWIERDSKVAKVLMGSLLVGLQYNRTVWPIDANDSPAYELIQATLLTTNGGNCFEAVPSRRDFQLIALCEKIYQDDTKDFYLSLISTASYKSFVVTETILDFQLNDQPRLIFKNDIIIVYTADTAYIMTLWEVDEQLQFIELDTIDEEDISGSICSIDLTFNDTRDSAPLTQILFSMIVTECTSNVYFTSFLVHVEQEEAEGGRVEQVPNLHVSSAQNINLIAKFAENHIRIPSEATVVQTIASQPQQGTLAMLAVYDKFHTYEFLITVSQAGVAYNITISKVYYKYGNYEAVSASRGAYLAIKYKSRLLGREERYCFFDVAANESKSPREYYMFSGYSVQNTGGDGHEIPWVFSGNTVAHLNSDNLQVLNISNQLRGEIKRLTPDGQIPAEDPLYTQKIQITANNVASARSVVIILKAIDRFELTGWQIALMVIGSIAFVIASIFGVRFAIRKYRQHKKMVPLLEDSQLEDAVLQHEQQERMSGRINLSIRGSVEPPQI